MAFNSPLLILYLLPIIALFCFPLFSSPVFSLHHPPTRGVLFEEKTRLGSTPPSCFNKCNQCHPCTAVQVTSLPTLRRVQNPLSISESDSSYGDNSRYSNYKPLGWKCRCKDHFYNP